MKRGLPVVWYPACLQKARNIWCLSVSFINRADKKRASLLCCLVRSSQLNYLKSSCFSWLKRSSVHIIYCEGDEVGKWFERAFRGIPFIFVVKNASKLGPVSNSATSYNFCTCPSWKRSIKPNELVGAWGLFSVSFTNVLRRSYDNWSSPNALF